MRMRSQARSRAVPDGLDLVPEHTAIIEVHPFYLMTGDRNAAVAIDQRTSDIKFTWHSPDDSADGVLWLYGPQSWATISSAGGKPYEVEQSGPRHLVDEVLAAYRWWQDAGEPMIEDWLVTVTPEGQRIELSRLRIAGSRSSSASAQP
ncbi:MAG: hypothetical protein M3Z25_08685 [Actinomycetota bacterium]|nr:hypothetical protein [Actinomycetota bacterium]